VAEVLDVFDSVPPPLTVQLTPLEFLSLVTVAVIVTVSVASTLALEGEMAILIGVELPPHPANQNAATKTILTRDSLLANTRASNFKDGSLFVCHCA
jgi:hypothetical protein